jgi:hypothetical protein
MPRSRWPARVLLLGALSLALFTAAASAQAPSPDAERYFRVEIEPDLVPRGGWAIQGYVHSQHTYRVGGVRLKAEVLDPAGQVVAHSFGWVAGDVPAGGRGYFYIHIPQRGASYRVVVLSFFLVAPGSP